MNSKQAPEMSKSNPENRTKVKSSQELNQTQPETQKGLRYNNDKAKLSMIFEARNALDGLSAVLEHGARKYHRANWREGLNHTEIIDSMARHMTAYMAGEDNDPESGLPHVDHMLCNTLFLSELYRTRSDLDDRPVGQFNNLQTEKS